MFFCRKNTVIYIELKFNQKFQNTLGKLLKFTTVLDNTDFTDSENPVEESVFLERNPSETEISFELQH